jgi:hypothetical protein
LRTLAETASYSASSSDMASASFDTLRRGWAAVRVGYLRFSDRREPSTFHSVVDSVASIGGKCDAGGSSISLCGRW